MNRRILLLTLAIIACSVAAFAQTCPPGVSWCSGAYSYDAMGNIRAIGADTYVYDTAGRLVSGTADVQRTPAVVSRQDYSYDAFGNRTGASRIAGSVSCLGGCELSPAIDPSTNHIIGFGAQYDEAGNLKFIQGSPDATYTYDAAGSLVHAVAGTDDRQFIYTADDERIATGNGANGATWTWTVRGLDGKVLREFTSFQPQGGLPTSSWQWTKDYVWRDGLLLASVTPTASGGTATQHFHLDHLGTPRLVTGDNGVTLSVHTYYPFGAELNLSSTEQPAELMKFTGHERDLLANDPHTLDYMHARYEMGTMGRFLSVDPVTGDPLHPQSWNRCAYALNNPMKYTDPTGQVETAYRCDKNGDNCYYETTQPTLDYSAVDTAKDFVDRVGFSIFDKSGVGDWFAGVYNDDPVQVASGVGQQIMWAAPGAASAATTASTRVFWSGGRAVAGEAAAAYAESIGGKTLEMTLIGKGLGWATEKFGYEAVRPAWDVASRLFAASATEEVVLVQGPILATGSTWARIEYPTLMRNAAVSGIRYFVVIGGKLVGFP
jgi:RHS repeat-associated protein